MKYPTISSAIEFAYVGDTLIADPATYNESVRFNGKNLHLKSTNPDDAGVVGSTVINAGSSSVDVARFLLGEDSSSMLEGLTLTGGNYGVSFTGNSSPVISKCIIRSNASYGIYCANTSSAQITGCTIRNNTTYGIYCIDTSSPQIIGSRIFENNSYGIYCSFSGTSNMLLRNSVIANHLNSGVYLSRNIAEIANCTIYGNTSYGVFTNNNTQQIRNSIIWGNGDNLYNFASGKVNYCCLQEGGDIGLGVHNFSLYPVFKNVANKDFHLWHSSACIDAGDPNSAFSNQPSPNGGIINVGAYGNTGEAQVSFTDADEDGISDGWEHYHWPNDDPNQH